MHTADSEQAVQFATLWTSAHDELSRYIGMLVYSSNDVDDILQLTATKLWKAFDEYDQSRPFLPWAIRFAYFEILAWRQKNTRDRHVFSEKLLDQLHQKMDEESPMLLLRRKVLDGCLGTLPEEDRKLLLKRYAEHGAIQREAKKRSTAPHKLYYKIDQIRLQILACIERSMNKEGFGHV